MNKGQRQTHRHVGERFGRLVLLALVRHQQPGRSRWRCRCDCGRQVTVLAAYLARRDGTGSTHSCGCLRRELAKVMHRRHGHAALRSGAYVSWTAAKRRCFNRHAPKWKDYGGRGITMCARWRDSFAAFLADMGPRPAGTSLDRYPDNDGNYEPDNCRWATVDEQNLNRHRATTTTN